jgi:hypothetical protein
LQHVEHYLLARLAKADSESWVATTDRRASTRRKRSASFGRFRWSSPQTMNSSQLDLLKAKMHREPFRAFLVEFVSGAQILIDADTEILFPRKRPELVIAFTGNGLMHEFESSAITRLIEAT